MGIKLFSGGRWRAAKKIATTLMAAAMVATTLLGGAAPVAAAEVITGFENMPSYDFAVKKSGDFRLTDAEFLSIPDGVFFEEEMWENAESKAIDAVLGIKEVKKGKHDVGTISLLYRNRVIDANGKEYDLRIDAHRTYESEFDITCADGTLFPVLYSNKNNGLLWVSSFSTQHALIDAEKSVVPNFAHGAEDKEVPSGLTAQQIEVNEDASTRPVVKIKTVQYPGINVGCKTDITFTVLDNGAPVEGKLLFGMDDIDTTDFYQMYHVDKQRYLDENNKTLVYTYGNNYRYNESVELNTDAYVVEDTYLSFDGSSLHATRISAGNIKSEFRTLLNTNGGSFTHYISSGATRLFKDPATFTITREVTGDYPEGGTINDTATGEDTVFWKQNRTYEITPANGYRVDKVWVDGVEVDPAESYTFDGVVADHDIKASFVPVERATVIYKTTDGTELEKSDELTGDQNAPIEYSTEDTIKKYTDKGYALVEDGFPADAMFDSDNTVDQEFSVTLDPIIEPITVDTAKTPEDQMNPDGTPYPEGLAKEDLQKVITRTIHYVDENGEPMKDEKGKLIPDEVQEIVWTRTATVNHVTGEVEYGPWECEDPDFAKVPSPDVEGYTFDKDVDKLTTTIDSENVEDTVTYKPAPVKTYTVTFVNGYDDSADPIDVQKGIKEHGSATAPKEPVRDGYTFKGWDIAFDDVTEDLTVTALWEPIEAPAEKTYTVTFVDGLGNTLKVQEGIKLHGSATAPKNPTRDGYTFKGWDVKYDDVTKDFTVTALWEKVPSVTTAPKATATPTPSPAKQGTVSTVGKVQTSDANMIPVIIGIAAIAVAVGVIVYRKRKQS